MRSRAALVGFTALLALGACAGGDAPVPADELRRDAEQGLRALGEGRFEVLEWRPLEGAPFEFVDDYVYRTRLYALSFDARVRCTVPLEVPGTSELDERIGSPGWSI